jgi:3-oxoadipate enol-lactonase
MPIGTVSVLQLDEQLQLAYRVLNPTIQGTPVLMIMGWSGVKEDWDMVADELARDHPVLIFDNRGIGESSVPVGPYTIQMMARDAVSLLDHVGWQKAHVVGVSMGGMIAQQLAVMAPERVDRLVLGCTTHGGLNQAMPTPRVLQALQLSPHGGDIHAMVRSFLWVNYTDEWVRANTPEYEERVRRSLLVRRPRRGIAAQLAAIMEFDLESAVARIPHETLIVHGTGDQLMPFANGLSLARKIRRSQLHALEGAGHLFWHMDGGQGSQSIWEFLAA